MQTSCIQQTHQVSIGQDEVIFTHAESVRFWRLNSIMALRACRAEECLAVDPDHLSVIRADNAELVKLEAREKAVKACHAPIYNTDCRKH